MINGCGDDRKWPTHHSCLSRFHRPWKPGVSSVKKCWVWSLLFAFRVSLNIRPAPGGMTAVFAPARPGHYWTGPHPGGWWKRTSGGASVSLDGNRGGGKKKQKNKNDLVIQSVLVFFVLFYGLLWQGSVNLFSGKKSCMWPASPFLNWWITWTVQSGEGGIVHTVCQSEWDYQCLYWKEKYLCKHYFSFKYKVFF